MAKSTSPKSDSAKGAKAPRLAVEKRGSKPSPNASLPQERFVPKFEAKERVQLNQTLQGALYDMVHLQLVTKQAHWNVVGPNFRSVHLHLDEVWEFVQESTDEIAERLNALGMSPDGQGPEVVENTRVKSIPQGFHKDLDTIELMCDRIHTTSEDLRAGLEPIEEVDTVTADLLHGVIEGLEKHLWMLRAHLISA